MYSLKRELIKLFKENLRLRQDYLKRRLNWTEENGKGEILILLFVKLACSSSPRRWLEGEEDVDVMAAVGGVRQVARAQKSEVHRREVDTLVTPSSCHREVDVRREEVERSM